MTSILYYIFAGFWCYSFMKTLFLNCCVHRVNLLYSTVRHRDTYQETGDPARLPAQLSGRWGQRNWNSVRWGKRIFCSGLTRAAKAEQNPFELARQLNEPTKDGPLFICSLWVPICPSFISQQGPPLSSLVRHNHLTSQPSPKLPSSDTHTEPDTDNLVVFLWRPVFACASSHSYP